MYIQNTVYKVVYIYKQNKIQYTKWYIYKQNKNTVYKVVYI